MIIMTTTRTIARVVLVTLLFIILIALLNAFVSDAQTKPTPTPAPTAEAAKKKSWKVIVPPAMKKPEKKK